MTKKWETYEDVARYVLEQLRDRFGLSHVEGKQQVPGASGTEWEIDAKALTADDGGFLIVECRRHLKARPSQEQIAGLCYRIQDTGAAGGIIVSPHDLQSGAELVANHEGVKHLRLTPDSTIEKYLAHFLNSVFVGVTDTLAVSITESVIVKIVHEDGTTEERVLK